MTQPTLAHNVRGRGRHYTHPVSGETVPSITNVIKVLDRPAIPRWAAKMVAESAWKMRGSLDAMGEQEAVDVLKGSPWRNSGRAADRGTGVHEYLAAAADGAPLPELAGDALRYKAAAEWFLWAWQPEFVATEFTVFGGAGWAGTGDFIATIGGRLVIGDYKTNTNGRVYPEVALQLAALRYADQYVDENGALVDMPEVDGCVAVSITPEGCRVYDVDAGSDAFDAFLACLELWNWQVAGDPICGEVREVRS